MKPKAAHLATTSVISSPASPTSASQSSATPAATSGNYKDGSYSAAASYYVPHGYENIKVNLTLSNGVVTNASVQNSENDPTSAYYQEDFASSFKSAVVGQKISSLQIGIIAGASDTTQGFNQAVSQIASQAQA